MIVHSHIMVVVTMYSTMSGIVLSDNIDSAIIVIVVYYHYHDSQIHYYHDNHVFA